MEKNKVYEGYGFNIYVIPKLAKRKGKDRLWFRIEGNKDWERYSSLIYLHKADLSFERKQTANFYEDEKGRIGIK
jgi:hypothetical protein